VNLFAFPIDDKSSPTSTDMLIEIESLQEKLNIHQFLTWAIRKIGVGLTPLLELPEEVNPYLRKGIHVSIKPEYLNPSGSGKDRPVSFMLQYYDNIGLLTKINRIVTAGFGNFIKSLSTLLPQVKPNITLETFMGKIVVEENRELIEFLEDTGVVIHTCEEGYCPTTESDKGKAVTWAYLEEETDPNKRTLFLDQHGYYKPNDGLLNAAGYYYTLAPEIALQTKTQENLYYVNGQGTRGSLMGTGIGLKSMKTSTKIIGLVPVENGHIFGLRSQKELGKSETLSRVENIYERNIIVNDKEAFQTMIKLWQAGIPASPSGGGHVAGALRVAKDLSRRGKEGNIVTLIFDSLELYRNMLTVWMPKILNVEFKAYRETFDDLKSYTVKERKRHRNRLRSHPDPTLPRDFVELVYKNERS